MTPRGGWQSSLRRRHSRRAILRAAGLLTGAGLLAACRGEASPTAVGETPTATPTEVSVEGLITSVEGYDNPTIWAGREITVTSWGGEYQDAQQRAIVEPFQRLTGARVTVAESDIDALKNQVGSGDVSWDVCDVLLEDVLPLANLGMLEELDYNVIQTMGIDQGIRFDHAIGSAYYSTILAYSSDRWPDAAPPSGWEDFWNLERWQGTRGLHRQAQTTLEFALIADGVSLSDLYPIDVDRAFASLDRIRDSITLWWEQGAQPAQLLNSGDIDMVAAWHSRIERVRQDGVPVQIQWNGGALSGDAWVIPKGSQNRDVAMDFINFATRPEVCAAFASLAPFGPVNVHAFDLMDADVARQAPSYPENRALQFIVNFDWWFKHQEQVSEQFETWLATKPD
ncbi:MAG: ABC transporter substrate-binding protein [Thermomicrobiales bacterium]|nr:ABC transporter substrate-binding protein [Thermomicrobiales bacterium]